MKLFKNIIISFQLLIFIYTIGVNGQSFSKSKTHKISVENSTLVEVVSTYTNIEFEQITGNEIKWEAILQIDGLSQKEAEEYFDTWKIETDRKNGKLTISSSPDSKMNTNWQRHGFYEGYFLNETQLSAISDEMNPQPNIGKEKNLQNNSSAKEENSKKFDQEAYINEGNTYLLKWQKEHNENIGKRWFDKTRSERIAMLKKTKPEKPSKGSKSSKTPKFTKEEKAGISNRIQRAAKLKKDMIPSANIRPLNKRAVIKKILKIGIPKGINLSLNMKHGKVVFSNEIPNIQADLKHVLFKAGKVLGNKTKIKGTFANFEIDHWQSGILDIAFSGFVLIKQADEISVTSNASVVSIDTVTKNIDAFGNFKMLSIDASSSITYAKIDVVDSKKVWIKLPNTPYNISYRGIDSRLIHPDKFSLKTGKDHSEQVLENTSLKDNGRNIDIKALASVMQIYDTSWEHLKIKSLEDL
ncbi:hypothetical protein [Aquimarina sp. 2201CG5-10]|uniref:hypothetical protein n=1 Tax=Aquimarina callyspongiae TaxID=3098150 RepID=UPI002AB57CF9|nr:hypothetical protein [Aquimarina sp. 2201CG5-10]MDY8134669.1 hypothetical protein [Aquimarina sp. 2201CG5-10]